MLKKLSVGLILLTLVTLSTPSFVRAEDDASTNDATTTSSEDLTADQKAQKLQERIASAKEKAASKISAIQEKRIAGLCKASQAKIENVHSSASHLLENRQTKYKSISDKLKSLSAKLVVAGADTTELDAAITEMDAKYETDFTAFNDYITSLSDLVEVDCAGDPAGFKAILEEARAQRKEILSQTTLIRAYIKENIKPILQDIRTSIEQTTNEEGEGTN